MNEMIQTDVGLADAIFHRRAVRSFSDREVGAGTVKNLLEAAVQAPSAMNQQPWVFAVFHGRKRLQVISDSAKEYLVKTYPTTFEVNSRTALYAKPDYDMFHGASTLIVIYTTQGRLNPNEDCCLAAENLMLAAYGMGMGTCPIGFARPWLDLFETKRKLGVPEQYSAVFPVVVGYPAGQTPAMPREEPKIVSWKWDDE